MAARGKPLLDRPGGDDPGVGSERRLQLLAFGGLELAHGEANLAGALLGLGQLEKLGQVNIGHGSLLGTGTGTCEEVSGVCGDARAVRAPNGASAVDAPTASATR